MGRLLLLGSGGFRVSTLFRLCPLPQPLPCCLPLLQVDPEGVIARQDLFSVYVHTMPGFYYGNGALFSRLCGGGAGAQQLAPLLLLTLALGDWCSQLTLRPWPLDLSRLYICRLPD